MSYRNPRTGKLYDEQVFKRVVIKRYLRRLGVPNFVIRQISGDLRKLRELRKQPFSVASIRSGRPPSPC